jgi:hypothetical protein
VRKGALAFRLLSVANHLRGHTFSHPRLSDLLEDASAPVSLQSLVVAVHGVTVFYLDVVQKLPLAIMSPFAERLVVAISVIVMVC